MDKSAFRNRFLCAFCKHPKTAGLKNDRMYKDRTVSGFLYTINYLPKIDQIDIKIKKHNVS